LKGNRRDERGWKDEENTRTDRWMKERRPAFRRRETVDPSCDEGKVAG